MRAQHICTSSSSLLVLSISCQSITRVRVHASFINNNTTRNNSFWAAAAKCGLSARLVEITIRSTQPQPKRARARCCPSSDYLLNAHTFYTEQPRARTHTGGVCLLSALCAALGPIRINDPGRTRSTSASYLILSISCFLVCLCVCVCVCLCRLSAIEY